MNHSIRPFVQMSINAVDLILHDPECRFDADLYDRYETFDSARDAALTSVEVMLDEADYDDEEHRQDLEVIRRLLETATTYNELTTQPDYQRFLRWTAPSRSAA